MAIGEGVSDDVRCGLQTRDGMACSGAALAALARLAVITTSRIRAGCVDEIRSLDAVVAEANRLATDAGRVVITRSDAEAVSLAG